MNTLKDFFLIALISFLSFSFVNAEVKLPRIFSSNMTGRELQNSWTFQKRMPGIENLFRLFLTTNNHIRHSMTNRALENYKIL